MFGRSFGVFAAAVVFMLSAISLGATYGGGSGTTEDPYQITNADELLILAATKDDYSKNFILTSDIDLVGKSFTTAVISPNTNDAASDFQGVPFSGVFDGNDYQIINLSIKGVGNNYSNDYLGLFGKVDDQGQIKNLSVKNVNIQGGYCIGGLAGVNYGTINSCCATGNVGKQSERAGGLVGDNHGTISSSWAEAIISGSSYVGGLSGRNFNTINNCYAAGTINAGYSRIGGLVGLNEGNISFCYAVGSVTGTGSYVGGLTGHNMSEVTSCLWDMNTTQQSASTSGKGLTTLQMKSMSVFQNAGWAGKGWVMLDGADYPRLSWQNTEGIAIPPCIIPFQGQGTDEEPYLISTAEEFGLLSWYYGILDKYICLTADLDLDGMALYPIGDLGNYRGVFDGQGHTISHVYISRPKSVFTGVFSVLGKFGLIRDLGVIDVSIWGEDYVGGLVGVNAEGTIQRCYVNGSVNGNLYVGGLSGWNRGSIEFCYTTGSVKSVATAGGLTGVHLYGTIKTSYAGSFVDGPGGGLIGANSTIITEGKPNVISSCMWDITTSGKNNGVGSGSSQGITGKTTEQMKMLLTFIDAGWDFVGEPWNGTNEIWRMCADGVDYPKLRWQSMQGDFICPDGVDDHDLDYFIQRWLIDDCALLNHCSGTDLDFSGKVDIADWAIFANHWLEADYIAPPLPEPAVLWMLDETEGNIASDSVGGYDGQVVNMTETPWVAGRLNNALKLDGVDDYVDVAGYAGITGTSSRTCMAWIKANSTGKEQTILSWGNGANGQKWIFRVQSDGKLAVAVWGGYISGSVSVADGQWHHVAAVLVDDGSPSVNEIRLYVDGFPQTVTSSSSQAINTVASQNVQMGSVSSGTAQGSFFSGLLDEVRIYDVPLTGEQILRVAME